MQQKLNFSERFLKASKSSGEKASSSSIGKLDKRKLLIRSKLQLIELKNSAVKGNFDLMSSFSKFGNEFESFNNVSKEVCSLPQKSKSKFFIFL